MRSLVLFSLALLLVDAERPSQTFDIPSLIVQVDNLYLVRRQNTTLSCQLSRGFAAVNITNVRWLKDGVNLTTIFEKFGGEDYTIDGHELHVTGGRQQSEGDYQCHADLSNLRLQNEQVISTELISAPVKLRRARITKFDKTTEHLVRVRQGEVARLPCAGLPDVIPGPPEICFEKEGEEGCKGEKNEDGTLPSSNYLATASGMQIAMVQPDHAGKYYCVVTNEIVNQTRKSTRPVILSVEPLSDELLPSLPAPQIVFPTKETSKEKPIIVDVVVGKELLLECVFVGAKVIWQKHNSSMHIAMDDPTARIRQLWGNLIINRASQADAGIYSCHGASPLSSSLQIDEEQPRVFYQLVVHAPTDVRLDMQQNEHDRSWMISCYALNHRYEIPMVFVNATPLIDAIGSMGVPSNTNFFTNPINVTLQVKDSFSGSVQCISRPAMEEAEVYGRGLERGRSKEIYVMSSPRKDQNLIIEGPSNSTTTVGSTITLICRMNRVRSKYWLKDGRPIQMFGAGVRFRNVGYSLQIRDVQAGDAGRYTCVARGEDSNKSERSSFLTVVEPTTTTTMATTTEPFRPKKTPSPVTMEDVRGFVTGTDVRIMWSVIGKIEGLSKVASFSIELKRDSPSSEWMEADKVDAHVRATTIRDLVPNNKYQFRIRLIRDDSSSVYSNETLWLTVDMPSGDVVAEAPNITSLLPISSTSARVRWTHTATIPNARARSFILTYQTENGAAETIRVDGESTEALLTSLSPLTDYSVSITAENQRGKSAPSQTSRVRTFDPSMDGFFASFGRALSNMTDGVTLQAVIVAMCALFLVLLLLLIGCIVCCNMRSGGRSDKITKTANGKFLDTSYRIFNEQKVHKARLYADTALSMFHGEDDDVDECSPLKLKHDAPSDSPDGFYRESAAMPNLYGNVGEALPPAPVEPTYAAKISSSGIYPSSAAAARCYSPDSGTSHEMLVQGYPTVASPQRVTAYKTPDSLLYSPAGTASSDTASTSVRHCDSPVQGTECSEPPRFGGSSRSSHVSSADGKQTMNTFKAGSNSNTTSFIGSTFDRRQ